MREGGWEIYGRGKKRYSKSHLHPQAQDVSPPGGSLKNDGSASGLLKEAKQASALEAKRLTVLGFWFEVMVTTGVRERQSSARVG
eukprot:1338023-Amorphochlora_amoeboformis.AAC.1